VGGVRLRGDELEPEHGGPAGCWGRPSATTTTATPGVSSATGVTDRRAVPDHGRRSWRPVRGARPDRRVVRVGRRRHHPGAAGRRWFRSGAADGDDAPPRPYRGDAARVLGTRPGRRHLPRRVDHVGRQRSPNRHPHPHPRGAVVSTPACSANSAGRQRFDPDATSADRRRSSKPSASHSSALGHEPAQVRPERFGPRGE
jgi:hypothetical protein